MDFCHQYVKLRFYNYLSLFTPQLHINYFKLLLICVKTQCTAARKCITLPIQPTNASILFVL